MSESVLLWLFGIMGAWMVLLSGVILGVRDKLIKIETILSMKSRAASKELHSPTDHLGIDDLLEKHHRGTITVPEWEKLKAECEKIVNDESRTPMERHLASEVIGDPKNGVKV